MQVNCRKATEEGTGSQKIDIDYLTDRIIVEFDALLIYKELQIML
jgi:hypothetical protein